MDRHFLRASCGKPISPLTLPSPARGEGKEVQTLPVGAVIDTLRALLDGTFRFDPSEAGHTRLRVPPTAV